MVGKKVNLHAVLQVLSAVASMRVKDFSPVDILGVRQLTKDELIQLAVVRVAPFHLHWYAVVWVKAVPVRCTMTREFPSSGP